MNRSGERGLPLPVLIDTPIWQAYFRKEEKTFRAVNTLMDAGRVCCLDLVVGELLSIAGTPQEMKVLEDLTRIFPVLQEIPAAWEKAARLSCKLRKKGKALSLRDCYVAVMAESHRSLLYTTNKSLHRAGKALPSSFKFFSKGRAAQCS